MPSISAAPSTEEESRQIDGKANVEQADDDSLIIVSNEVTVTRPPDDSVAGEAEVTRPPDGVAGKCMKGCIGL